MFQIITSSLGWGRLEKKILYLFQSVFQMSNIDNCSEDNHEQNVTDVILDWSAQDKAV